MTPLDDRACPDHRASPTAAQRLHASVALAPDQCRSLLEDLAHIADPGSGAADGIR
jgi:hypothetical protein